MNTIRFAFAGDRDISVKVLSFLLSQNAYPLALMVSHPDRASHAAQLRSMCQYLPTDLVFVGKEFRSPKGIKRLRELELDYIIAVHFPYIFPKEVLEIPKEGVLNLHPAFLPYNRGWHTPSWSILENTPAGATLHFMDEGIDTGDIVHQRKIEILPNDTAHSLYARIKEAEFGVFKEAWPLLLTKRYLRRPQDPSQGTTHRRKDLLRPEIQKLQLDQLEAIGDTLKRLRALTTNNIRESAYFEVDGKRYHVQIQIFPEKGDND